MSQSQKVFTDYYQNYRWGSSESHSGPGSTIENTEKLRASLKQIIQNYNIKSVTDFPCGDLNWIQLLFDDMEQYTGCDIVQECISENQNKFPQHRFECLDLSIDEIPVSDLLIVRDVIGHQPLEIGVQMLNNIKNSGCKYLLSTTWAQKNNIGWTCPLETRDPELKDSPMVNQSVPVGGWYPINLMSDPFLLPLAEEFIEEDQHVGHMHLGYRKTLGLWNISSLHV